LLPPESNRLRLHGTEPPSRLDEESQIHPRLRRCGEVFGLMYWQPPDSWRALPPNEERVLIAQPDWFHVPRLAADPFRLGTKISFRRTTRRNTRPLFAVAKAFVLFEFELPPLYTSSLEK